jgi:ElaB/YqjD/DUF883 family membrane-anchored ribosome-binding protein
MPSSWAVRRARLGGIVLAVAVGVVAALAGPGALAPGAVSVAAGPPGRPGPQLAAAIAGIRPGTVDVNALHAEALQVLTRDYQVAVDQASSALTAADGNLQSVTAALSQDQDAVATATAHAASATQAVAAATATLDDAVTAHAQAVTAHTAAVQAVTTDEGRLAQVGIALYMGPPPPVSNVDADLSGAQSTADGALYLRTGDQELSVLIHTDRQQEVTTAANERRLAHQVSDDQQAVDNSDTARQQASAAVTAAQATVATDEATVASTKQAAALAQAALAGRQQTMTNAVNGFGAPAPDGSPTIIGTSALVPTQIAGWFTHSSYQDATAATPAQLAAWYVSEGAAEGVRGDIAFAQAVVETGGFSSPDAITLSNFAGIGHCDSCAAGLGFPSPQGGVRGQVQLLRIFASPPGTPLTQPAIIPQVAPGGQFRGGCCPSWQSLTGTWASNQQYGQVVLGIYQKMLDYALAQPPIAPGSPAAGDTPAAPAATGGATPGSATTRPPG